MSENYENWKDYTGKLVRVGMFHRELIGPTGTRWAYWKQDKTEVYTGNCWEPLPVEEPISALELLAAGMFCYENERIIQVGSDGPHYVKPGQYRFSKDALKPKGEWRYYEDLTREDLK